MSLHRWQPWKPVITEFRVHVKKLGPSDRPVQVCWDNMNRDVLYMQDELKTDCNDFQVKQQLSICV